MHNYSYSAAPRFHISLRHGLVLVLADSSFACLALLEDETFQLFELLMQRTDDVQVNLLLDVILQETRKHRELLRHLSRVFETDSAVSSFECGNQLGEFFRTALALIHSVKDEVLQGMPVVEAAKKLISFEEGVGEEYLTAIHANIKLTAETNPATLRILESIVQDEEGHAELLRLVIQIASNG